MNLITRVDLVESSMKPRKLEQNSIIIIVKCPSMLNKSQRNGLSAYGNSQLQSRQAVISLWGLEWRHKRLVLLTLDNKGNSVDEQKLQNLYILFCVSQQWISSQALCWRSCPLQKVTVSSSGQLLLGATKQLMSTLLQKQFLTTTLPGAENTPYKITKHLHSLSPENAHPTYNVYPARLHFHSAHDPLWYRSHISSVSACFTEVGGKKDTGCTQYRIQKSRDRQDYPWLHPWQTAVCLPTRLKAKEWKHCHYAASVAETRVCAQYR